jgi:hypothetical protein
MTNAANNHAIGDDLRITKIKRRTSCGGCWISGTVAGHSFSALVFAEHADDPAWEIGDSRISKLWIARLKDQEMVFNWDRGMDTPARSAKTRAVVDFLAAGLAEHVYGK